MTHISLMLEYFHPWPNAAGYYAARAAGFYAEQEIDVEIIVADPGRGDTLHYLAEQAITFGIFPSNRLLVRREQNQQLTSIAAINHTGLESIQTIANKKIHRPRDLEGKNIALNPTPRGIAMVKHLVEKDGGNPEHLTFIDCGTRELTPEELAEGIADASFGGYWAWEALMSSAIPDDERITLPVSDWGAPPYHSYLLGTHDQTLQHQPELTRRFLLATAQGYHYAAKYPLDTLKLLEQVIPYFPKQLLADSLKAITPTWFHKNIWGKQRPSLFAQYAQWLYQHDIIKSPNIWKKSFTNRFLPNGEHIQWLH